MASTPSVTVIGPEGSSFSVFDIQGEENDFTATFATTDLSPGVYGISSEICIDWEPVACMNYRTRCELVTGGEPSSSYYPLDMGNSWSFSDFEQYTETIVDTERFSGDQYFQFESNHHSF